MNAPATADPDDDITTGIKALHPPLFLVEETPTGRLAALDLDTALTYQQMWDLLTNPPPGLDPTDWAQQLQDLAGTLCDLHKRTQTTFIHAYNRRWFR